MPRWSDYTTGARIKILRGKDIRQSDLAEMTGLSVQTIQQAEQDKRLTLQTLLKVADVLGVDTSVILGQQAPRRAMEQDDRAMMRALSRAVHDTAAGLLPETTQAVGIDVALGQTGKALTLIEDIKPHHEKALWGAARQRYAMDKAMAQADAEMWDTSLDTLEAALLEAPDWARHQAMPSVIVQKVGKASTARLRRVSELIGVAPGVSDFLSATSKTAL